MIFSGKLWTSILMILNPVFFKRRQLLSCSDVIFCPCDLILEYYILQGDEANLFRSLGWVGGQNRNVLNSLTPEISTQKMQNPWNWGVGGNESVVHRNQFWSVNFTLTLYYVRHFLSVFLDILIRREIIVIFLWHIKVLIRLAIFFYLINELLYPYIV